MSDTNQQQKCKHEWIIDIIYDDQSFDRHCSKCFHQQYVIAILKEGEMEEIMARLKSLRLGKNRHR
ncbi:hypothetical protein [Paenibacillus hexagrammi]|uniref:Uncharacterized protein n=1 Tax=Paenibacillus hexagrammi TaxID=2908839 RepID=A0ABY3SIZ0_9BACL|nr:hypothetical protein [Paenibacillus sp. YPD9-1]UJF33768.1 hypothetical protein L0M14_00410 [Paenibacillus sp. YPD9-1]